MLVFPHWRSELPGEGCRVQRWMPAERFAPYLARPVMPAPLPPTQFEDDDSSGGSSPDRNEGDSGEGACGWRGCSARFPGVARLSAHVARTHAHAHSDGLFYCGWSGCARPQRGFNARYKMLVHVRTHTNERPHTCNQCHKSFSRAENLKIHLRSHSGEKPYVCPYEGCGKAYSNSSDRFKHTRTHAVEKPYCCKVPGCNKRYTDPSSLRKHVKTYKHFTTEQMRRESSEEAHSSDAFTPPKENTPNSNEPTSPLRTYVNASSPHLVYSARTISPIPYSPMTDVRYTQAEHITYVRPLEPIYPVRVPSDEMSYVEYTQMYEHAYRNYYSSLNYPVLRPTIGEKVFTYEEQRIDDSMDKPKSFNEEMPLNLITKRLECRPIEELVKCTDYPLDLSTKS